MPGAAVEGTTRVLWRLIGFKGIRGGSIGVPNARDGLTEVANVLGFQYEVE